MEAKLRLAAVVQFDKFMDPKEVVSMIKGTDLSFGCLTSISPTKILLFFDEEDDLTLALGENSPLRQISHNVRMWSESECIDERLTWVKCSGINPVCWSHDTFEKISGLWGKLLYVDQNFQGINSLTMARLLIQTNSEKIDNIVCLDWGSSSCMVNVKEVGVCDERSIWPWIKEKKKQYEKGECCEDRIHTKGDHHLLDDEDGLGSG
ncbi:unnamed protein product [Amaranthus hypochondriacus]